ncbi:cytochrome P450 [Aspergillus terreus]|uniref:Cytochrome P450 n=1 Tax=Aspergillus terreus TaxID=33178 RepID=A0A5M3Z0T0_ASPTE|nr:hypothetical protein ATETN484_0006036500 [Aspergillus terreus]GFF12045.1 cytochrome P450 [Aspergillus terreus]
MPDPTVVDSVRSVFLATRIPFSVLLPVCILIVLPIVYLAATTWSRDRALKKLPGTYAPVVPSRLPFGLDVAMRCVYELATHGFHEYVRDILATKPGRTIEFHILDKRMIVTDNPENIKEMMSVQFDTFGKGDLTHHIFRNCFRGSIFGSEGAEWAAHRAQLKPHVGTMRPSDPEKLENHFLEMLQKNIPDDGSPVEVYDMLDMMLLETVIDIFVDPSKDPEYKYIDPRPFVNGVNALLKINTFRVLLGNVSRLVSDTLVARASTQALHEYLGSHVRWIRKLQSSNYSEKPKKEWTLMETFASEPLPDSAYRSKFVSLLSASKDPVGMIVVWVIYELGRRPEIVDKLREEIIATIGDDINTLPTDAQLRSMKYLQNIIKEAMRMYHPFGFNIRCPNKDTVLPTGGGANGDQPLPILRETFIVVNIMGLHRRADIVGADTDVFRPERWDTFKPSPWEYMPFHRGPRNCLGMAFGQYAMAYLIVRLYQLYDILPADNIVQRIKVEMNTKVSHPVNMRFYPRQSVSSPRLQKDEVLP